MAGRAAESALLAGRPLRGDDASEAIQGEARQHGLDGQCVCPVGGRSGRVG